MNEKQLKILEKNVGAKGWIDIQEYNSITINDALLE